MISWQLFLLVSQRRLYNIAHWLNSLLQISSMAVWLAWLTYTSCSTWQQLKVEDAREYSSAAAAALRRRRNTGDSDDDAYLFDGSDDELSGFVGDDGSNFAALPFILSFDNDTHRNTLSSIRSGLGDAQNIDLFEEIDRMNDQDAAYMLDHGGITGAGGLHQFKQRVYKMVTRAVFMYPTLVVILYALFLFFLQDSYRWMWLRLVVFDVWMFMVVVPASWHWLPHSTSARYAPLMEHMPAAAPVMEMASVTTARAQEAASSAASKLATVSVSSNSSITGGSSIGGGRIGGNMHRSNGSEKSTKDDGLIGDSRFAIAPDGDDDAQLDENPIFEDDEEDQMIV